ncbi:MAG: aminodeoxychorismate synthase component I [Polyangiales bacterium]
MIVEWEDARGGWSVAQDELAISGAFFECFAGFLAEDFAVLLDSAAVGERFGRCSVIGIGPAAVLTAWAEPLLAADGLAELELRTWRGGDQRFGARPQQHRFVAAPFAALSRELARWAWPAEVRARLRWPFVCGALGFVGYDAGRVLERLPSRAERDLAIPDYCFLFVDALLIHEHASGQTHLVVSGRGVSLDAARREREALAAAVRHRLSQPLTAAAPAQAGPVEAHADADEYAALVREAQAHVLAGDVFEVCTAHRLSADYRGSGWPLYRALRSVSPAAFACYVSTPWCSLLSSSPERFLRLDTERWAETRPIKGTRPRGSTPEEDEQLRAELAASEKDRAENVMIVDLARNDLGRVCEVDSVHVPELMVVETHPRVFHMVSTVRGRLAPEHDAVALFEACFPPGSMTGAPKIEAMKIIDALERYQRSLYAGAVGYFDVGGALDFSVVIRSFVLAAGRCHFSVGGAIVADSEPYAEYRESMDKARALLEALARLGA